MDATRILLYFSRMTWPRLAATLRLTSPPTLHLCEVGWRWERSAFVDFDLWVVLRGEGELEVNQKRLPVSRGEGILFRPGDSVKGWHNPKKPLRVFAAHFTTPQAAWLRQRIPHQVRFYDLARLEELAQRVQLHETTDGWAEIQLAALLAEAARQASLSLSQFNKRFRAYTGTSPARYVILQRIDRAKKLLAETPMTLQQIADALGYSDIYYFHRQFRAETGQTPGSLRGRSL